MDPKIKGGLGLLLIIIATILHYTVEHPTVSFFKGFLFALGLVYLLRSFTGVKRK